MTSLSIVTVCRNDLRGLQRTIQSVLAQTTSPAELIVVDGASTDGTANWLASAGLPSYVSWTSEPDHGIYDAMNKGMRRRRAHGLVMWLNAGDCLAGPETLTAIHTSYETHRWRWAVGHAMTVDADGRPLRAMVPRVPRKPLFVIGLGPIPHPSTVFSSPLLDQVGEYDQTAGVAADQQYMLRCWKLAAPHPLGRRVALFDATGVSSTRPAWFCAQQMRRYRLQLGRPLFGSSAADLIVTSLTMGLAQVSSMLQPQMRLRQAMSSLTSRV